MPTAPYSRISRAPEDASDRTLEVLEDEGVKFTAPFRALIWHVQEHPKARGVDSTEVDVTSIDGDTLTFVPTDDFAINEGLMIAVLRQIDSYDVGDTVRVTALFPEVSNDPGTLLIQTPAGELREISGTVLVVEGPGDFYYDFQPDEGGLWQTQWRAASGARTQRKTYYVGMDYLA